MTPGRRLAAVAVFAAALLVGACRGGGDEGSGAEAGADATGPATTAPVPTLAATEADVGFLQDMLDHHGQAVVLATAVVEHGDDPRVRALALDILVSQSSERGQLQAYLRDRGHGPGDPGREAMAWAGHAMAVDEMPGMLAGEELGRAQQLRGAALDERFVALMAEHHEGGVEMAREGRDRVRDPAIADLAALMVSTQERELTELALLARR